MSEEYYRMNDIFAKMTRGNHSFNVVLSAGARGVLLLLQHFYRMHKEKMMLGGEVESFEKYLKATKGNFDIVNVPLGEGQESLMEEFKADMDKRGIRYHILPDLDSADERIQVCVYQPDASRFAGCFREYIQKQLSGGEMAEDKLLNLTDGHASMISIPAEDRMNDVCKDLDRLKINYALMPDLKVGDGQRQMLVANHDLPRLKQWYQLFKQREMNKGKGVPDFKTISLDEYRATAEMKAEDYIGTSSPELKARLEKYQTLEKGEFAQAVDELEEQARSADTLAFEKCIKDPNYEMLSVDHETLVVPVDRRQMPPMSEIGFTCRIPGTYGDDVRYLAVPMEQVFRLSNGDKDRYLCFVSGNTEPNIYDKSWNKSQDFSTGKDLMVHFDKAREQMAEEELKKIAKVAERLAEPRPLPNPVKTR